LPWLRRRCFAKWKKRSALSANVATSGDEPRSASAATVTAEAAGPAEIACPNNPTLHVGLALFANDFRVFLQAAMEDTVQNRRRDVGNRWRGARMIAPITLGGVRSPSTPPAR